MRRYSINIEECMVSYLTTPCIFYTTVIFFLIVGEEIFEPKTKNTENTGTPINIPKILNNAPNSIIANIT